MRRAVVVAGALVLAFSLACQKSVEDRLEEVRAFHELGAWDQATEELQSILDEHPDHAEANQLLGITQLRQGRPSLAVWPLQMATRDPELALESHIQLAAAYLQLDQTSLAIQSAEWVLERAHEAEDDFRPAVLHLLARAYLAQEKPERALEAAEQLVELRPEDPGALALRASVLVEAGRFDEAEGVLRSMWEGSTDLSESVSLRAALGLVSLYQRHLEDPEAAEGLLEEMQRRWPGEGLVVRAAVEFFDAREEPERGNAVLQQAIEAEPTNLELRKMAAERLVRQERPGEAEGILIEATEFLDSPEAWLALEDFRRRYGEPRDALAALERALELLPEPTDVLRFKHADLLLSNGQIDRAQEVVEELGDSVYAQVARGRIAFERGEHARALDLLDEGLRRWPNNPGARLLAGRAALAVGELDRALSDLREAVRATRGNTDAGLELARLHLARGESQLAFQFAASTFTGSSGANGDPDRVRSALILLVQALTEQGNYVEARKRATILAGLPEGEVPALLGLAAVAEKARGPEAAAAILSRVKRDLGDAENLPLLRALGQYLVDAGQPEEALRYVNAALENHPDVAELHEVRGRLLLHAGRLEGARRAFEAALERDPAHAPALVGLGHLEDAAGSSDRAHEYFERSAAADPGDPEAPYAGARMALAQGDLALAERRLREALERDPTHPEASNDLAWILAERGESLDEALRLARRAAAFRPTANVLDTLGWVELRRGEAEKAVETLERAHGLEPESPSIAYRLALALGRTGREDRARVLLREALSAGAFPEASQAREQLARLGGEQS